MLAEHQVIGIERSATSAASRTGESARFERFAEAESERSGPRRLPKNVRRRASRACIFEAAEEDASPVPAGARSLQLLDQRDESGLAVHLSRRDVLMVHEEAHELLGGTGAI